MKPNMRCMYICDDKMVTIIRIHSVALFLAMYVIFVGYDMLKTKISELKEIALKRELKVFIHVFTAHKDVNYF